ncbi:MAG: hypothetical protein M1825_005589 [Sarcosagium campestre]|nr:MAG: hypothetical protein M1825_005589 [Sarcosagium campestre]
MAEPTTPIPPPAVMMNLPLLRGTISLDRALSDDDNMLNQILYPKQRDDFWRYLLDRRADIEDIVSFHVGRKPCEIASVDLWICGSYNVCIPVFISPPFGGRVLIRIPLPYKVGEAQCPGNVNEKLRCEAASYLWLQENSPEIAIPFLYGFGAPDGVTFTAPEHVPIFERCMWTIRRTIFSRLLRLPTPTRYVRRQRVDRLKTGYLIISRLEQGSMLSNTWAAQRHDKTRRSNLFHGLARIILSLGRKPLERIGSLTLDDDGVVTLTNRPLTLRLQTLENEGIQTGISRTSTYPSVEPYVLDLLSCHDNRIHQQPNSIHNVDDGEQQMAALTMMRALLHHFTLPGHRHGPFAFTLTDLHASNIFVDDDWHITGIIDLEWACSMPKELQLPPYWLTDRGIDQMRPGEHLEEFRDVLIEYLEAFEHEERALTGNASNALIMREGWEAGSFWYFLAVESPKGLLRVFSQHVQRLFCVEHCTSSIFDHVVAPYWSVGATKVIEQKLDDEIRYKDQLQRLFADLHDDRAGTE